MRRLVTLIVVVGMVVVFGGMALAGGFGECGYSAKVNQAAADKANNSKVVTTQPSEKTDADKLVLVQTDQAAKPAPETKK